MNPNYTEFKFPQIKAHPWHKVRAFDFKHATLTLCVCGLPIFFFLQIFHKRMPPEAVDLVSRLLQYSPNLRCTAVSVFLSPCTTSSWIITIKRFEEKGNIYTLKLACRMNKNPYLIITFKWLFKLFISDL